ncbi:MAG: rod shape-determining protein MreC [Myxococcota bacterium]
MGFRYKRILIALLFFLVPFLILYANTRRPEERGFISRSVIYIQYPLEYTVSKIVRSLGALWTEYVALVEAKKEALRLKEENRKLMFELNRLNEEALENVRLRRLLDISGRLEGYEFVSARIYGAALSPLAQTFRIDRGAKDGVRLYSAVLSGEGLLGRISSVGEFMSEVIPITDSRSYIPCRLRNSRIPCTVAGRGAHSPPEILHIITTEKVAAGEEVVTDAILSIFPPGLYIGKIGEIEKPPNALFIKANLVLSSNIENIEEVFVIIPQRE